MKLRCDGQSPCSSCRKRNIECSRREKDGWGDPGQSVAHSDSRSSVTQSDSTNGDVERDQSSLDRGSVKFLLNAGTEGLTERIHLPPSDDRSRGLVYHKQTGLKDGASHQVIGMSQNPWINGFADFDWNPTMVSPSFIQSPFATQFHGPNVYSREGSVYQSFITPGVDGRLAQGEEPGKSAIVMLCEALLAKAYSLPIGEEGKQNLASNVLFMLDASRVWKFLELYFENWHVNAPMIHPPSFNVETVPLSLLATVVIMGAIYSTNEHEAAVAKGLLDFVELFVFSGDVFSRERGVVLSFTPADERADHDIDDWISFQNVQAGFVMLNVQYWAGKQASQCRAMEIRFSEVLMV